MSFVRCRSCHWDFPSEMFAGIVCEACRLQDLAGARNYWGVPTAAPGLAPTASQAKRAEQQMWWIYAQGDNVR